MQSFLKLPASLLFFVSLTAPRALASPISIGFEGLPDGASVGAAYSSDGVQFTNAMVSTSGISLNESEFPPHSGQNVVTDFGGPITITFAQPVSEFEAYFTYAEALQLSALNASNFQVASAGSLFSANYTSSGNAANELIELISSSGFTSITIAGDPAGGSFVMDDMSYQFSGAGIPVAVTPEPAGVWLLGTGFLMVLGFRRFALNQS